MGGNVFSKDVNVSIEPRRAHYIFNWIVNIIKSEDSDAIIEKIGGLIDKYHKGDYGDIDIVISTKLPPKGLIGLENDDVKIEKYKKSAIHNYLVKVKRYDYRIQLDIIFVDNKKRLDVVKWTNRGKWFNGVITRILKNMGYKLSLKDGVLKTRKYEDVVTDNIDIICEFMDIDKNIETKTDLIESIGEEKFINIMAKSLKNSNRKKYTIKYIKENYKRYFRRIIQRLYNFRKMPKIKYFNNLEGNEKEHIIDNLNRGVLTPKIDGYNISFGIINGKIYIKTKNSQPIFEGNYFNRLIENGYIGDSAKQFRSILLQLKNKEDKIKKLFKNIFNTNKVQIFAEFVPKKETNVVEYRIIKCLYIIDAYVKNQRIFFVGDKLIERLNNVFANDKYFFKKIPQYKANNFLTINIINKKNIRYYILDLTKREEFNYNVKDEKAEGIILDIGGKRVKFVNKEFIENRDKEWKKKNKKQNRKRKLKINIGKELNWDLLYNISKKSEKIADAMITKGDPNINKDKVVIDDILSEDNHSVEEIKDVAQKYDLDINHIKNKKNIIKYIVNHL